MESSNNRFIDGEDDGITAYDIKQLKDNCEKWSLASDLGLLSHLKQFSNDLLNKTENTNQSINSLVYETKIHCVKVNNVMNDFQMLANSQFVENRVYDEEIDDIITGVSNGIQNDEMIVNKSKDEDILPKIKSALNIGLNFLSERFDNISKQTSQTDSDDENDQILEGLISHTAEDEYSQRLLPYIIGSEEFIKDNFVGLSCVEENPTIDLKTKVKNDVNVNNISGESNYENTFPVHNNITNENSFNDDLNDSEEESGDIFGGVSHRVDVTQHNDKQSFSDESDSDQFSPEVHNKDDSKSLTNNKVESKPILSFHDQLSAAIKGHKVSQTITDEIVNKPNDKIKSNNNKSPLIIHSDSSSDESESIFRIPKSKPKETKSNYSNLFGEQSNNTSLFDDKNEKQIKGNNVLPNINSRKVSVTASALFDDEDDEEDDDLFGGVIAKKVTQPTKNIIIKEEKKTENNTQVLPKSVVTPLHKESLFDDDEEDDDLFSGISIKTKTGVQNTDAFKDINTKSTNPSNIKVKSNTNLIGELSEALKKKSLYISDEENSIESIEDKVDNEIETIETNSISMNDSLFNEISDKNDTNSQILTEKKSIETIPITKETESKSDRNNSITSDIKSDELMNYEENYSNDTNAQNDDDFYSVKSTNMLSNDSLKQRAKLGSKRNRRPPSKKVVKLTPITDFSQNYENNLDISLAPEEKSPPIASIRNVKPQNKSISDSIINSQNKPKPLSAKPEQKSLASLLTSPSTEEEDIFPSHTNSFINVNITKPTLKSNSRTFDLFNDNDGIEDSLFTNSVKNNDQNYKKKESIEKSGLFDMSDSDDEQLVSNHSNSTHFDSTKLDSNKISSIKSSEKDIFNISSSTDSSLSNKSDLKNESLKPNINLFSDSDDDLFSAVAKSKSFNKTDDNYQKEEKNITSVKVNKRPTKLNSLFSDSEDDKSDLFKKTDEIKQIKTKTIKPLFDVEDDDEDDIFSSKSSKVKISNTANISQKKLKKESVSSDIFDDPLFVPHS